MDQKQQAIPLPVHKLSGPCSFDQLFELPQTDLQTDWFDSSLPARTRFVVALNESHLLLGAECAQEPCLDPEILQGEFAEGLWKKDVAEIFVCEDDSSRYQEFNLSPKGAWWSGVFTEYRKEDHGENPRPVVETFSDVRDENWKAAIRIARSSLSVKTSFTESSKANVTFIINGEEQRFVSFSPLDSEQPDFHKLEKAANLKIIER